MIYFNPIIPLFVVIPVIISIIAVAIINITKLKVYYYDSGIITWIRRIVIALLILIISLGPTFKSYNENKSISDIIALFVVDNSGSMSALEDSPAANTQSSDSTDASETKDSEQLTRLDHVRKDINQIANTIPPSKYAGIVFNSNANLVLPLTTDKNNVESFADSILPEITSTSAGTDFASPINTIKEQVNNYKQLYPKDRIILFYFSDGDYTSSMEQEDFSEYEELHGLFAGGNIIGYGSDQPQVMKYFSPDLSGINELNKLKNSESNFIIKYGDSYITDPTTGQNATSKINIDNLKTIASATGSKFVQRNSDEEIKLLSQNIFVRNWSFSPAYEKSEVNTIIVWPFYYILAFFILWEFLIVLLSRIQRGIKP